jgi:hypothetical protein
MLHSRSSQFKIPVWSLLFLLAFTSTTHAYSVLSHEALIDSAWDLALKPLILSRFPDATPEQLKEAHSYAWGGAVIQDMGYYPFGSKLFSDLAHYVHSGDFVVALIRDSKDINEYAFALGAMAHYVADNEGHRIATNRAVPILYPKLRAKYGDVVVYDQDPGAHLKAEFGFDVLEVAKGRYAPDDYREHIGFQVSQDLLQRAFEETYCLKLNDIFTNYDFALSTYRYGVGSVIPKMTKVAWQTKKDEIMQSDPGMTRKRFLYHLSHASYRKEFGANYQQPGFGTRFLALFLRILPKVGPLRALSFHMPTPETEKLFMASFNDALQKDEDLSRELRIQGHLDLVNDNFDTGTVTGPGEYPLADKTYADLLDRLSKDKFAQVTPVLREDIVRYFSDPHAPYAMKKNKKQWEKVVREVNDLKTADLTKSANSMN